MSPATFSVLCGSALVVRQEHRPRTRGRGATYNPPASEEPALDLRISHRRNSPMVAFSDTPFANPQGLPPPVCAGTSSGRPGACQRAADSYLRTHNCPREDSAAQRQTLPFVQQLKEQNTPHARNSLFLRAQGVMPFSAVACAQNSGTIRATRPLGRGTARRSGPLIYD
jgi:hypothetical protein